MANIRVGLIRCDTHGMWYGALMAEHDPLKLQRPMRMDDDMRYSWQRGGVHFCFYLQYSDPRVMTADFVGGFDIVKVWDEDRRAAQMFADVFVRHPLVCDSFEQVSDDVDLVFIADCNYDGADHLKLARPGLEKGLPTFVDKPFANTVANAKALLDLAESNGAPILSLSILRAEPAVARFRARFSEIRQVNFATVQGGGASSAGMIHAIAAAHHLFGLGIEAVAVIDTPKHRSCHLDYGSRPGRPVHGVMINCDVGPMPNTSMCVSAYGSGGPLHLHMEGDLIYDKGTAVIIRMIRDMVSTRRTPPLMHEALESIAVLEAYWKAVETGRRVPVRDILSTPAAEIDAPIPRREVA